MDKYEFKDDIVLAKFINYMQLALYHRRLNYLRDMRVRQRIETPLNEEIEYESIFCEDDEIETSVLSSKELHLLNLHYDYGLTYREISNITNETISALKLRKKRAVDKLKDILEEWIDMEENTEFYELLKLAVTDDVALAKVLGQIMNLINKYSRNKYTRIIDEDLKSELLTYTMELVRIKKIYKKFSN